jgi:hypothetical protein
VFLRSCFNRRLLISSSRRLESSFISSSIITAPLRVIDNLLKIIRENNRLLENKKY